MVSMVSPSGNLLNVYPNNQRHLPEQYHFAARGGEEAPAKMSGFAANRTISSF